MALNLRPWQESAINKCLKWFDSNQDNKFLVNAAPGAGKTICASVIALELIKYYIMYSIKQIIQKDN